MNTANLPVILEHTENLKYELESKIQGIESLFKAHMYLDIWRNHDEPHVSYTNAERTRLWEMIVPFEDECRDNFLRITDEGMAGRYRYLLRQYFAFLETASQKLREYETAFWTYLNTHLGPDVDEGDWFEQNADTYYGTLLSWTALLFDGIIPDVQRIVNTYNGYLLDRSVANIIAPDEPLHALLPAPRQQNTVNELSAKLTWQCKPAVAGYLISELIRAGYLSPPTTNGELSLNKLAKICEGLFDIAGHNPSLGSWRNVLDPERNTLSDTKRVRLNLPDADQL